MTNWEKHSKIEAYENILFKVITEEQWTQSWSYSYIFWMSKTDIAS